MQWELCSAPEKEARGKVKSTDVHYDGILALEPRDISNILGCSDKEYYTQRSFLKKQDADLDVEKDQSSSCIRRHVVYIKFVIVGGNFGI
ncbi:hypothetical protein CapIbe_008258 [Capra ibex]